MLCQWQISFAAMSFEHILILALIQGVTEFIPVSSSGHLNLLHALTDRPDQGVVMDVALHGGTLLAVMAYFRADVARLMLAGWISCACAEPKPRFCDPFIAGQPARAVGRCGADADRCD